MRGILGCESCTHSAPYHFDGRFDKIMKDVLECHLTRTEDRSFNCMPENGWAEWEHDGKSK